MKTHVQCIPCYFNQLIVTATRCGLPESEVVQMCVELGHALAEFDFSRTPAENSPFVSAIIRQHTGEYDNFVSIKEKSTAMALQAYPLLKDLVAKSHDPIAMALRIAAVGNIIDFGVPRSFDLDAELRRIDSLDFAVFDYDAFQDVLGRAENVLIIGDNAGETVFDRVLLEALGKPAVYAVRSAPALNDALAWDAVQAGLDQVATIIESGSTIPSTVLAQTTQEFRDALEHADLVISKGQGNFEGLSDTTDIFFLLKAKCEQVARELGVRVGDLILKRF